MNYNKDGIRLEDAGFNSVFYINLPMEEGMVSHPHIDRVISETLRAVGLPLRNVSVEDATDSRQIAAKTNCVKVELRLDRCAHLEQALRQSEEG